MNLQRIEDFQALHQTANKVKRQVCKDCDTNNQRFDARVLGFPCGWTEGGAQYHGTCRGCFWCMTRWHSVQPWLALRRFEEALMTYDEMLKQRLQALLRTIKTDTTSDPPDC